MTRVFGAGGKGGGGGSEAPDNLNSTAYARIVDVLSEGEIEGFATPSKLGLARNTPEYNNALMKDVFYNKTRLLRVSASNSAPIETDFNFKGAQLQARYGTQSQPFAGSGFEAIEEEISVGSKVEKNAPVTRTISDENVDAVRVTINIPALQQVRDNGDIVGTSINLQIQAQYNGGGFQTVINDTISGRTGDLYQKDYIIYLSNLFPVDIRVVRITDDSNSVRLQNEFLWNSYTEIVFQKLTYPNTAYIASRIDASQFSSIPSRSYRIRGIRVKIPSNATVDLEDGRLTYNGIWDGTFGAAQWTTCPSWILYDLLTSTRYGFGDHVKPETLDKWAFYTASKYCNELVPTGKESPLSEPRFSCNVNIQAQEDAYKLISDLASVFRAMTYWAAGSVTIAQDRPQDSVALFTLANVDETGFNYETSSLKSRATAVAVSWFNLEIQDIDIELVEDPEGISKYGIVQKQVEAFATTSRSQAKRVGEWLLYSDNNESEVVTFRTTIDKGMVVRPGAVIEISDIVRAGARKAGRVTTATTTAITVDSNVGLGAETTLAVVLPDARVEVRSISSIVGKVIVVSPGFSLAPQNGAVWMTGLPLEGRGGGECGPLPVLEPCSAELNAQGGFMWALRMATPVWTTNTIGSAVYQPDCTTTYSLDGQTIYTAFKYYPATEAQNSVVPFIVITRCDKTGTVQWVRKFSPGITQIDKLLIAPTPLGLVLAISPFGGGARTSSLWHIAGADGSIIWQKERVTTTSTGVILFFALKYAAVSNTLVFAYRESADNRAYWQQLNIDTGAFIRGTRLNDTVLLRPNEIIERSNGTFVMFINRETSPRETLVMILPSDWSSYTALKNFALASRSITLDLAVEASNGDLVAANTSSTSGTATFFKLTPDLGLVWARGDTRASVPSIDLDLDDSNRIYLYTSQFFALDNAGGNPPFSSGAVHTLSADGSTGLSASVMFSGNSQTFNHSVADNQTNHSVKLIHTPDNAWIGAASGQRFATTAWDNAVVLCSGSISNPTASKTFSTGATVTPFSNAEYRGSCAPGNPSTGTSPTITDATKTLESFTSTLTNGTFTSTDASAEIQWVRNSITLP